jgi:hypothetical protein
MVFVIMVNVFAIMVLRVQIVMKENAQKTVVNKENVIN